MTFRPTNGAVSISMNPDTTVTNVTIVVTSKSATEEGMSELVPTLSVADGSLVFTISELKGDSWFTFCKSSDLEVLLPSSSSNLWASIKPMSLEAVTVNGDVSIESDQSITWSSVSGSTNDGSVYVYAVTSTGVVTGATTNGGVTFINVTASSSVLQTTNGQVSLTDGKGDVRGTTTNGGIDVTRQEMYSVETYYFSSVNGDIDVTLNFMGSFDATTTTGSVSVYGTNVTYDVNYSNDQTGYNYYPTGYGSLTTSTTSGNINVYLG